MLISYNWLRELTGTTMTPEDLRERLTMVGLAIDAVEEKDGDAVLEAEGGERGEVLRGQAVNAELAVEYTVLFARADGAGARRVVSPGMPSHALRHIRIGDVVRLGLTELAVTDGAASLAELRARADQQLRHAAPPDAAARCSAGGRRQ